MQSAGVVLDNAILLVMNIGGYLNWKQENDKHSVGTTTRQ